MAQVVMSMRWAGVTPDQYEEARQIVDWEGDVADGAVLHVAYFDSDGIRVTDVWESEQAFSAFMTHRLAPAIQEIGIQGQPEVKFFPMHGVFAPALGKNEQVPDL